ncbi:MAG: FixH family protein [Reinekea sp.]
MTPEESPWYKQFWLWFIITPLAILVCASFYLLYLAITTNDGVVLDNYYRDGKGYVLRTEEDQFARSANLAADLQIIEKQVTLKMTGNLAPMPEKLLLILSHPTEQNLDVTTTLTHRGMGEYTGALPETVSGRRILQLQPVETEQGWRLHFDGKMTPEMDGIKLLPRQK